MAKRSGKPGKKKPPTTRTDEANEPAGLWRSKIVGHDRIDPASIVANPLNFRTHPQAQRDALAASIEEVGFVRSVTVNKRTGNLVDGHERVWQALKSEQPLIDVEYVDLSEEEERKMLAVLDAIGEMAEIDNDTFLALMDGVETSDAALAAVFERIAAKGGLPTPDEQVEPSTSPDNSYDSQYGVIVICSDEDSQKNTYERLLADGYNCRVVVT
jgi:hypothetical protein